MKFDNIIANAPYAKIGCDITKNVIEQNPDSNYAMLGTRSMFKPFYADTLACQFVQIGQYELGTNKKLDWGVEQAILLATNGWTEVVDNRKKVGENKVGIEHMAPSSACFLKGRISHLVGMGIGAVNIQAYTHRRTSHLVGVDRPWIDHTGSMGRSRTATLVQAPQGQIPYDAYTRRRSIAIVQVNKSGPYLGGAMDRHTANVTDTKPTDVKLRNGYIYVSFETFEEACECAIDIISWTNPTDSHYRCVRWGFVTGLVSHER